MENTNEAWFEQEEEQKIDLQELSFIELSEKELDDYSPFEEEIVLEDYDFGADVELIRQKEINKVKAIFKKWLSLKDDSFIDVVLMSAISPKLEGDDVWLFLIAPPGATKTETLRVFNNKERFYEVDDLTSASFVTGLVKDTKSKMKIINNEGKITRETENNQRTKIKNADLDGKVLICKDFTLILNKNANERNAILSQLRNMYDGKFSKKYGTLDEKVDYVAKFGVIFGVTSAIDRYWKSIQILGERFLKVRIENDRKDAIRQAVKMQGKEKEMRKELNEAVNEFLDKLIIKDIRVTEEQENVLVDWAEALGILRTPVPMKNSYQEFDFFYKPDTEFATRLVKQLKKLLIGLTIIHNKDEPDEEEMNMVKKVVFDTIPQDRLDVLRELKKQKGISQEKISKNTGIPFGTISKILEQLEQLKVVETSVGWGNCSIQNEGILKLI